MALVHKGISDLDFRERLRIYSAALHDIRMGILRQLEKTGSLAFSDMEERFAPINPNTLTFHLKKLAAAKLIDIGAEIREGSRRYSKYTLTPFGAEVLSVKDLTAIL